MRDRHKVIFNSIIYNNLQSRTTYTPLLVIVLTHTMCGVQRQSTSKDEMHSISKKLKAKSFKS